VCSSTPGWLPIGPKVPGASTGSRRGRRPGARVPGGCLGGSRDPVPAAGREHQREDRTGRSVTEPIRIEFEVACSPAHAFDTWASKTSMWWTRSHSMSSAQGLVVTFESRPGGRICERTPDGTEHDWGEVPAWEPPRRLAYLWHLGTDRTRATEVDISLGGGDAGTIVHRGRERLGADGPPGVSATSEAGAACCPTTGRRQPHPPLAGAPGGGGD